MSTPPKLEYEVEDRCYVYTRGSTKPVPGMVLASFTTPYAVDTYYIIMLDDPNHAHFKVRNALQMSPADDAPPPISAVKIAPMADYRI